MNQSSSLQSSKLKDLKSRILFLVGALMVFRLGAHIPLAGINPANFQELLKGSSSGLAGLLNMFSGGAFSRLTVMALGIVPFISMSIVMQLLAYVMPALEDLKKEGEAGRRKLTQYTRYGTVLLALFQSLGISAMISATPGMVTHPGVLFQVMTAMTLTGGTMFMMWLGEQITERGIGNGTSILIAASIASGVPGAIGQLFELVRVGGLGIFSAILTVVMVAAATLAVVFVERGQRKVPITYARREIAPKAFGNQNSHLPMKLNMAGAMPPIFASTVLLLPGTLASWVGTMAGLKWLKDVAEVLNPGHWVYNLVFTMTLVFFAYFYTSLVFNTKETADNLKRSGAFVPGMRPGEQTAKYLDRILERLTLAGAVYLTLVCLLPVALSAKLNLPFNFGGTSLLILSVTTMDFIAQAKSYLLSHQYGDLLKKRGLLPKAA